MCNECVCETYENVKQTCMGKREMEERERVYQEQLLQNTTRTTADSEHNTADTIRPTSRPSKPHLTATMWRQLVAPPLRHGPSVRSMMNVCRARFQQPRAARNPLQIPTGTWPLNSGSARFSSRLRAATGVGLVAASWAAMRLPCSLEVRYI